MSEIKQKTNWRQFECIFSELPKTIVNRADQRIQDGDEGNRVKHTSKKIKQDGSWNSLALDELERAYAKLGSYYDAIESGLTREEFIEIFCEKD